MSDSLFIMGYGSKCTKELFDAFRIDKYLRGFMKTIQFWTFNVRAAAIIVFCRSDLFDRQILSLGRSLSKRIVRQIFRLDSGNSALVFQTKHKFSFGTVENVDE
jgi:hypothetical protein